MKRVYRRRFLASTPIELGALGCFFLFLASCWPQPSAARLFPAAPLAPSDLFFPLTQGTYWIYRGTVEFSADTDPEKSSRADVEIKMQVEKVIDYPDFTVALASGLPSDLDWATGAVQPKPSLIIETKSHEVYLNALPPDFDYLKLTDPAGIAKFLQPENLVFRWPLKEGMKFGDAESLKRDDGEYCWRVAERSNGDFTRIKGAPSRKGEVFELAFVTNPDDSRMQVSHGIGIVRYAYHHHGTIANTEMSLAEFHFEPKQPAAAGTKP